MDLLTQCYRRKPIVVNSMPDTRAATQNEAGAAARAVACHAEDRDIQRCMFRQIPDRLCAQFPHDSANFSSTKPVSTDLGRVANTINAQTKELCLKEFSTADVFQKNTATTPSCSSCDARAFCLAGSALPCNPITMSSCARVIEGIQKRLVGSACGQWWKILFWMLGSHGCTRLLVALTMFAFMSTVSCSDAHQTNRMIELPWHHSCAKELQLLRMVRTTCPPSLQEWVKSRVYEKCQELFGEH